MEHAEPLAKAEPPAGRMKIFTPNCGTLVVTRVLAAVITMGVMLPKLSFEVRPI